MDSRGRGGVGRLVIVFTIGFTKTSAEHFFGRLKGAGVRALIDVRLNNVSQLAGFAKRDDLAFFTREIAGASYAHRPELAPTRPMLEAYRRGGSWDAYARSFLSLMASRRVEETVPRAALDHGCLLCSEDEPHRCHRRLVAEYLATRWGGLDIEHL